MIKERRSCSPLCVYMKKAFESGKERKCVSYVCEHERSGFSTQYSLVSLSVSFFLSVPTVHTLSIKTKGGNGNSERKIERDKRRHQGSQWGQLLWVLRNVKATEQKKEAMTQKKKGGVMQQIPPEWHKEVLIEVFISFYFSEQQYCSVKVKQYFHYLQRE